MGPPSPRSGEGVAQRMGKAGMDRCRFAAMVVPSDLGPHSSRRHSPVERRASCDALRPFPASWRRGPRGARRLLSRYDCHAYFTVALNGSQAFKSIRVSAKVRSSGPRSKLSLSVLPGLSPSAPIGLSRNRVRDFASCAGSIRK